MKKTLKDILCIARIFVILLLLYAVLDLFNVPSRIGFPIENVNWDAAGVLCGNLIVVALFVITYQVLDKRSVQKEHNRRKVAVYMLQSTLEACISQIKGLKDPDVMKGILERIDLDKMDADDPNYRRLLTTPFADHEYIISFASEGVISEKEFSAYNRMRERYRFVVVCYVFFYDVEEFKNYAEDWFNAEMKIAKETFGKE